MSLRTPGVGHQFAHLLAHYFGNRFVNRVVHKALWAAVLPACTLWSLAQAVADHRARQPDAAATHSTPHASTTEAPRQWRGATLRPLALSEVEQRFAQNFPGSIARLTDGNHVLVLRTVTQASRKLHPATDCYQGLGYRIHSERLEVQADQQRWRCFVAQRAGRAIRVCERIEDAQGQSFTDTSAWYWASVAGQSHGPWQAFTVATPLGLERE